MEWTCIAFVGILIFAIGALLGRGSPQFQSGSAVGQPIVSSSNFELSMRNGRSCDNKGQEKSDGGGQQPH